MADLRPSPAALSRAPGSLGASAVIAAAPARLRDSRTSSGIQSYDLPLSAWGTPQHHMHCTVKERQNRVPGTVS